MALGRWARGAVGATAAAGLLALALPALAATSSTASCTFGATPSCSGLSIVGAHTGDSLFSSTTVAGESADVFSKNTTPGNNPVAYIYLAVPSSSALLASKPTTLYASVEYYDKLTLSGVTCSTTALNCALLIQYDSSNGTGIAAEYYNASPILETNGSGKWTTATFTLKNINFTGAENNSADLRLAGSTGVAVHSITLSATAPSSSTSASTTGSTSASTTTSTSTKTSTSTTSSGKTSTTTTTTSLPKTGGSPLLPLGGAVAGLVGIALAWRRPRDASKR